MDPSFLILFINLIILFQLTFTFIYRTFNNKKFNFNKISKSQTNSMSSRILCNIKITIFDNLFM